MAKQKIVVKVTMNNNRKARKAMKIAVSVCGVDSASLMGSDKDLIEVTGDGIDPVELAKLLRRGVGCTEILSVGTMEETKPAATATAASQTEVTVVPCHIFPPYYNSYGVGYHVYEAPCNYDSTCTIM